MVTLHGTESGVAVLSCEGNAVVIRPQDDGLFIVTGAAHHSPSSPLNADEAIKVALSRFER